MRKLVSLFLSALLVLTLSCRKDNNSENTDNTENSNLLENTGEPSVTAGVEDLSFFMVTLCGYHNEYGVFGFILNTDKDDLENGFHNETLHMDNYTIQHGLLYKIKTTIKPNTTYYFRSYCEVGEARYLGEIMSFTTPEFSVKAFTDDAVVKSPVEVELNAHFSVEGPVPNCHCVFQYGTDPDHIDQNFPAIINEKGSTSFFTTANLPQIGVTYYYKAKVRVAVDGGEMESDGAVKSFIVPGPTADNPIDLGGGVQWRAYNVGASSPQDYGYYFYWGETTQRSTWPLDNPYTDVPAVLPPGKDAATANLGSDWRMPTRDEFEALGEYCIAYKTRFRNKTGILFVSKNNGNSMFLPSAGYYYENGTKHYEGTACLYWSASPAKEGTSAYASAFYAYTVLGSGSLSDPLAPPFVFDKERAHCTPVRPVKK